MENNLTLDEIYITLDALCSYFYGHRDRPNPSTKHKIRIIQKKLLSMEKEHETK